MAKAGMKRPGPDGHNTGNKKTAIPKDSTLHVQDIHGKAKKGHQKAKPV